MEQMIDNGVIVYASMVTGAVLLYLAEKVVMFVERKKNHLIRGSDQVISSAINHHRRLARLHYEPI